MIFYMFMNNKQRDNIYWFNLILYYYSMYII